MFSLSYRRKGKALNNSQEDSWRFSIPLKCTQTLESRSNPSLRNHAERIHPSFHFGSFINSVLLLLLFSVHPTTFQTPQIVSIFCLSSSSAQLFRIDRMRQEISEQLNTKTVNNQKSGFFFIFFHSKSLANWISGNKHYQKYLHCCLNYSLMLWIYCWSCFGISCFHRKLTSTFCYYWPKRTLKTHLRTLCGTEHWNTQHVNKLHTSAAKCIQSNCNEKITRLITGWCCKLGQHNILLIQSILLIGYNIAFYICTRVQCTSND